jgi:hypothetical protein
MVREICKECGEEGREEGVLRKEQKIQCSYIRQYRRCVQLPKFCRQNYNMKLYTDYTGKFQMYLPINWEYKNPSLYRRVQEGTPQAFGMYDKALGAFQISCKPITDHIKKLIKTRKEPLQSSDSEKLQFSEQLISQDKMNVYAFSCAVDDHYFFSTYIVTPTQKTLKIIDEELSEVRKVLSSVKFIKPQFRGIIISQRRTDLYMASIATIIELKNKAIEKKSFIEYIVFSANHIDALLRLSIILNNQITKSNKDVDLKLLFQSENDKAIMERTIYKQCLDLHIIDQPLFDELENLYKERNKIIHRYIITDIRTEDIFKIATDYEKTFEKVDNLILRLEAQQVEKKVGIWGNINKTKLTEIDRKILHTKIRDKQGRLPERK